YGLESTWIMVFAKSMKELDRCYTMRQELCSVIVGGALIHKNCEGSKHEGRRIDMVPPKVTPQLPKPEVKVKEVIVKAEEYGRGVKRYKGFRVDVKRKSIEDKVRHEVFDVDEAYDIENSRASSFQVRGIHVDVTKVNTVRDWSSSKTTYNGNRNIWDTFGWL
nr:hypothetical protein [Tanacetum cinerariifolium]